MSTDFLRNYIDIIKEAEQPRVQLDEGIMDSLKGIVAKIKAIPGIQRFIQAAQAKKAELIQAAQSSSNGQELVKNIQAAVGAQPAQAQQPAVAEGWLGGILSASAGGGLMAAGADLFMRAWLAMGKPDLTAMTAQGNYDGKIVLALTTMLVLCGALSLFMGGLKVKDAMDDDMRKQKMANRR